MRILKDVVEHPDFKGYYPIPDFSNYVISKQGAVININRTTNVLNGNPKIKGYRSITLVNDRNERITMGLHKLVATTFLACPGNVDDYVPNHIDEDPSNNALDNIEWVTVLDNVRHSLHKERKHIPVDVRNIETGETIHFNTLYACAKHFNVHVSALRYRCEFGRLRIYDGFQFKFANLSWVTPTIDSGVEKRVLLRNVVTGKILKFPSQSECSDYLSLSQATMSEYLNNNDCRLLPGLHLAKKYGDKTPWKTFDNPELDYARNGISDKSGKTKGISVTDANTGKVSYYNTAANAAADNGLKPTTLNWRLKKDPSTIHPDGKQYAYL